MMQPIPTAAEKALKERDRTYRQYRKKKREEYAKLFADPVHGDRMRRFHATLSHFNLTDPPRMRAYVQHAREQWLGAAPLEIRYAALEMISFRIVQLRVRAGKPPFDDPLPGQPDDTFRFCKRELGL